MNGLGDFDGAASARMRTRWVIALGCVLALLAVPFVNQAHAAGGRRIERAENMQQRTLT